MNQFLCFNKFQYLLLMIFLSSIFVTTSHSQEIGARAQKSLNSHISNNKSAGITGGFATADSIIWIGYAGYSDIKIKKPVDSLTYFRMASIAKPITAVAIMQLYEKGKLDLDKPISEYIPNFPIKKGELITVRHLLQHSSGIGGYKSIKESETKKEYPTLRDAIKVFERRKLKFTPGTNFHYTSYGYVVLGWVIENVSGLSYEAYITERTNLSNRIPGGGLYTTSKDLLKFGQAILKNKLINIESLEMLWTDAGIKKEGNPYCMGWYIYPNSENPEFGNIYGHAGGQAGASTQLVILPKDGLVAVIMSNTARTWGYVFGMTLNFIGDAMDYKNLSK